MGDAKHPVNKNAAVNWETWVTRHKCNSIPHATNVDTVLGGEHQPENLSTGTDHAYYLNVGLGKRDHLRQNVDSVKVLQFKPLSAALHNTSCALATVRVGGREDSSVVGIFQGPW